MTKPFLALMPDDPVAPVAPRTKEEERSILMAELFDRARRGDIPRSRPLHSWEADLLNERHIQAIMMRCMGMRQKDIAKQLDYTDSTVSIILNHPDSTYIIDRIQGFSGVDVADIEARLRRLTPQAVDAIEDVFEDDCSDPKLLAARVQKARMGFSLLEHTGHGPKPALQEHRHEHAVQLTGGAASLLSRALRESNEISNPVYSVSEGAPGSGVEGPGPLPAFPSGTEAPPLGVSQEHPLPLPAGKAN